MTSLDWPTPEALAPTVPHFSTAALDHLVGEITPLLPPAPRRGPKGMPILERIQLALAHLREGVSLRGLARIKGIPPTTLRDNVNPVLAALDQLEPVLPDGRVIEDFDVVLEWCALLRSRDLPYTFLILRMGIRFRSVPFLASRSSGAATEPSSCS
jgi:hypothetical protein